MRYLGASTVFQTLIVKVSMNNTGPQRTDDDLQQGQPGAESIPDCIHAADHDGTLLRIPGADLIGPSIDNSRDAVGRPGEEEGKELEPNGDVPYREDDARKDVQAGRCSNQGDLGVVRIGQDTTNDGRDDGDSGRDGGDGVDGLDAVPFLLEPQWQAAVGRDAIGLREKECERDEHPEVPTRQHSFDQGPSQRLPWLSVLLRHASLGQLDLSRREDARLAIVWLAGQGEEPE